MSHTIFQHDNPLESSFAETITAITLIRTHFVIRKKYVKLLSSQQKRGALLKFRAGSRLRFKLQSFVMLLVLLSLTQWRILIDGIWWTMMSCFFLRPCEKSCRKSSRDEENSWCHRMISIPDYRWIIIAVNWMPTSSIEPPSAGSRKINDNYSIIIIVALKMKFS